MPGLTAWQGLFVHGRLQAGQSVLVHGAAGAVGSMVTQLARQVRRLRHRHRTRCRPSERAQLGRESSSTSRTTSSKTSAESILVFDVIGGNIGKRSAGPDPGRRNAGDHRRADRGAARRRLDGRLRCPVRSRQLSEIVQRCVPDGCGRTSATLRSSTMPSPPSTATEDAREEIFGFAREGSGRASGSRPPRRSLLPAPVSDLERPMFSSPRYDKRGFFSIPLGTKQQVSG